MELSALEDFELSARIFPLKVRSSSQAELRQ